MTHSPYRDFITYIQTRYQCDDYHSRLADIAQRRLDAQAVYERAQKHELDAAEAVDSVKRELRRNEADLTHIDHTLRQQMRRLEQAHDGREYQAAEREIAQITVRRSQCEDAIIQLWDALEQTQQEYDQIHMRTEQERLVYQTASEVLQQEEAACLSALKADEHVLQQLTFPTEWQESFEAALKRTKKPYVPAREGHCTACNAAYGVIEADALRHHRWVSCKRCYRMLYDERFL